MRAGVRNVKKVSFSLKVVTFSYFEVLLSHKALNTSKKATDALAEGDSKALFQWFIRVLGVY
jgi:hypothetical protein